MTEIDSSLRDITICRDMKYSVYYLGNAEAWTSITSTSNHKLVRLKSPHPVLLQDGLKGKGDLESLMARHRSLFERLAVSPNFAIPRVLINHEGTEERATIYTSGSRPELIHAQKHLSAQAAPAVKAPAGDRFGGLGFEGYDTGR